MKKKFCLISLMILPLVLSSCTSRSEETKGALGALESPVPTIESNSTIESEPLVMEENQTPTPSTESVEDTTSSSTSSEEDLLATVPKDIYDPEDFTTPLDDQWKKVDEAYDNGLINDKQYTAIYFDTRGKQPNGSSTTGSSTSGDTYIPAHEGAPSTVMDTTPTGYEHANDNIDYSGDTNVTIE